tara:strand:+ start:3238 stop:5280 length:2043 start_codon:yes stop_codon:yes gene_type:complete
MVQNPLLEQFNTPFETVPFDKIENEHFLPGLKTALEEAKSEINAIVSNTDAPTFENTILALEFSGEKVGRIAEIFFNLNSAETNDAIQKLAQEISPLLSEYRNDILLNEKLFQRIDTVYQNELSQLTGQEEKALLEKTWKGFVRNGAKLSDEAKEQLRKIDMELSKLSLTYGEHLLADTNNFQLHITNEEDLAGLPEGAKDAAAETAKEKALEGWVFTLQYPSYIPFMMYAEKRELREQLYRAFNSKAFHNDENDNQEIVKQIAQLRYKRANLLGYKNHADFVLEERMAESPENVNNFLQDLLEKAKPFAEKDIEEVKAFAKEKDGFTDLQRWDFSYYSEQLKKQRYEIDDEILKPYFKLENVVDGVFKVAQKLYGLTFVQNNAIPKYHPEVVTYEVLDKNNNHLAVFYADFFPREGKRNGAWMTSYRSQKIKKGKEERPHVSIVCNFTKPTAKKPSLLTFNEVTTLFHEFGHALHGMLAQGKYPSLTGTSVFWDFVELPSQVLENWCYEKEALDLFAIHYETGEKIPEQLVERIKNAATFQEGYATIRQLSFGLLDMAWHGGNPSKIDHITAFESEALASTELFEKVQGTNVSCQFAHIFQGGYSAGYYSYKWAEVLDADAFEYFLEEGIFNTEVAQRFEEFVLSAGGREHPMELYKKFRGKEPSVDALLKRAGLVTQE